MRPNSGGGPRGFHPAIVVALFVAVLAALFFADIFGGSKPDVTLRIVSGSENKALESIIKEWADDEGVGVEVKYLGSVDIARELEKGAAGAYDAVWPAHSLWIAYGDRSGVVKDQSSILRSPVVLGVKKSIAAKLGWVGRTDVTIDEIRKAAEGGAFRLAMTSATQSNSGASAYFGFLYAMSGRPDILKLADLEKAAVRDGARALLKTVDRSSGSSGWLKDAFVANPSRFDAMFNYEAIIIEANQALTAAGGEPLYMVYPSDGLAVADSPLGFVARGGEEAEAKAAAFAKLKAHLLSEPVQKRLISLGRRAGLIGLDVSSADPTVWNPAWGVDLKRAIAPIPTPARAVIARALTLYQTELRKPSLTVWVLDVSGSMDGEPIQALKKAMRLLLEPEAAERALLSPSPKDVTVVIAFNSEVAGVWKVEGNDPAALRGLLRKVEALSAGGGTDLYRALDEALRVLSDYNGRGELFDRLPAIVAMTDGRSSDEWRNAFLRALRSSSFGADVPIHAIAFGKADEGQLKELTDLSIGRLFKARSDLSAALRKAKGYN
ncbi:MAG: substrate-binding and VWA domain-containing protein [Neomegalonema sp.]|nr:substrate-binding and VWA domain-containing protein [Neomegalonema sp.]